MVFLRVYYKVQIYFPSCDFHEDDLLIGLIKENEYWNIKLQNEESK